MYQLFEDKNIPKSTIYQTIKDYDNGLTCVVKPKIGKYVGARKNNIAHSTVFQIMKTNYVIHKKRVKVLTYVLTQLEKILRCCRFLLRKQKVIVMDDEK
jgi:predicted transcriptional regulator